MYGLLVYVSNISLMVLINNTEFLLIKLIINCKLYKLGFIVLELSFTCLWVVFVLVIICVVGSLLSCVPSESIGLIS